MANEVTVPLLPCPDVDEIVDFYRMLGFTCTYHQYRPNPYVSLQREDLRLGFFGIPDFKPEDSYGTCLVLVADTQALFDSFAAGMRAAHGKLLVAGIPRITRPRKRKNAANSSGFSVIDPGGNWIRIHEAKPAPADDPPLSRLGRTLESAVVMGDSHGLHERAARILDGALEQHAASAPDSDLLEAWAYRAELALRSGDSHGALDAIARAGRIHLSPTEREQHADTLSNLQDLADNLRSGGSGR